MALQGLIPGAANVKKSLVGSFKFYFPKKGTHKTFEGSSSFFRTAILKIFANKYLYLVSYLGANNKIFVYQDDKQDWVQYLFQYTSKKRNVSNSKFLLIRHDETNYSSQLTILLITETYAAEQYQVLFPTV